MTGRGLFRAKLAPNLEADAVGGNRDFLDPPLRNGMVEARLVQRSTARGEEDPKGENSRGDHDQKGHDDLGANTHRTAHGH
jgi:hypothetical protein